MITFLSRVLLELQNLNQGIGLGESKKKTTQILEMFLREDSRSVVVTVVPHVRPVR